MPSSRLSFRLLLVLLAASTSVLAADAKSEILAVMEMQQAAWNRGDLSAFMEGYEKSPEITFVGKTVSRGFDGLVDRYQRAYGDKEKMGQLTFSELEYKPLGTESAFLIGRFQLQRSEAGGGDTSGRFTVIFRKTAAGWRIVHDHTSAD